MYDVPVQQSPDGAHLSVAGLMLTSLYIRRSKLCQDSMNRFVGLISTPFGDARFKIRT